MIPKAARMEGGLAARLKWREPLGKPLRIRSIDAASASLPRNTKGAFVSGAIWPSAATQFASPQSLISRPRREPAHTTQYSPSLILCSRRIDRASLNAFCGGEILAGFL